MNKNIVISNTIKFAGFPVHVANNLWEGTIYPIYVPETVTIGRL